VCRATCSWSLDQRLPLAASVSERTAAMIDQRHSSSTSCLSKASALHREAKSNSSLPQLEKSTGETMHPKSGYPLGFLADKFYCRSLCACHLLTPSRSDLVCIGCHRNWSRSYSRCRLTPAALKAADSRFLLAITNSIVTVNSILLRVSPNVGQVTVVNKHPNCGRRRPFRARIARFVKNLCLNTQVPLTSV
jgi:hypothetical protein